MSLRPKSRKSIKNKIKDFFDSEKRSQQTLNTIRRLRTEDKRKRAHKRRERNNKVYDG